LTRRRLRQTGTFLAASIRAQLLQESGNFFDRDIGGFGREMSGIHFVAAFRISFLHDEITAPPLQWVMMKVCGKGDAFLIAQPIS